MVAPNLQTFPEIDGIRGILSLIVVAGHVIGLAHWPAIYHDGEAPLYWYWGCMEIFFCISGFLITRNLIHTSERPRWIRRYVGRRILRIWPAYYVALAMCALISTFVPPPVAPTELRWNQDWLYLLKTMFFLQYTERYYSPDISSGHIPSFGHSWSVALEEQFYLLILLVIWARSKSGRFQGYWLLAPLVLLMPMSQLARHFGIADWTLAGRAEGFLYGIALAILEPLIRSQSSRLSALRPQLHRFAIYAILLLPVPFMLPYFLAHGVWERIPLELRVGPFNPYVAFSFLAMCLLATLLMSASTPLHTLLRNRLLCYFGEISYSTYLFHIPVLFLVYFAMDYAASRTPWFLVVAPVAALLFSSMTYRWIELPFLSLKKRLT